MGPDLIVGYNRGYRASWQTALGKIPNNLYETNRNKWSGDHCMAAELLPGMLLINRPVNRSKGVDLRDLTATILAAFELPQPPEMQGRSIL
jgi:hypothetical protein